MSIIGDIMGVASGISGYQTGHKANKAERAQLDYETSASRQISNLLNDPSSITESGTFKTGMEAVMRSLGSQGLTGSGNALMALQDYGANYYMNQIKMLQGLASGTPSVGTGTSMMASGGGLISSLGGALPSPSSMFGGGGGGAGGGSAAMGMNQSAGTASIAALA